MYREGSQKIIGALNWVDEKLLSLWYTYRDQKKRDSHKIKRWGKFLSWTKGKIQGGQNAPANVYSRYDAVRHKPNEPPYYFDSFLASIERDLPKKDDKASALAFFSKLSTELKTQFKTAHVKVPKSRAKCVVAAQEIWEGLHPEYQKTKEYEQRIRFMGDSKADNKDQNDKNDKGWKRHHTRGNSQAHESKRQRKDKFNLHHRKNSASKEDKDQGKKQWDRKTHEERKEKDLCYNCGKRGHYSNNCPEKNQSKGSSSKVQQVRFKERSTSPEVKTQDSSDDTPSDSTN